MPNAFDTFADPYAASQGSLIPSLPGTSANSIFNLPNVSNLTNQAESSLGVTQSSPNSFWQSLGNALLPQLGLPGIGPGSVMDPTGITPADPTNPSNNSGAWSNIYTILTNPGRDIAVVIGIIFVIVGLVLLGKSPILQTVKSSGKALATAA